MDDLACSAEPLNAAQEAQALVIIGHQVLARACILSVLKKELTGFDIVETATAGDLNRLSGRQVRLIALNIGDRKITDPLIEKDLAILAERCPNAFLVLLSNRDDEATASAAMQRGVRGFFPSSIPLELVVAGLRLVLAGGVYRPLPTVRQNEAANSKMITAGRRAPDLSSIHQSDGATAIVREKTMVDLTPRERQVLAAMKLGLPNKLIAAKLGLSENTIKMHIQHIMRKCSAHNRTEAVLRFSEQLSGHGDHARSRVSSSS